MCCQCFERVDQEDLTVDPEDGKKWDVCKKCHEAEQAVIKQRSA